VPMHVDPLLLHDIQGVVQCRVEGFPQTYLGQPLSVEKLRLAAFTPLIAKVDKYLSAGVRSSSLREAASSCSMPCLMHSPPSPWARWSCHPELSRPSTSCVAPSSGLPPAVSPAPNAWWPRSGCAVPKRRVALASAH
jgi:hypothetical protein